MLLFFKFIILNDWIKAMHNLLYDSALLGSMFYFSSIIVVC